MLSRLKNLFGAHAAVPGNVAAQPPGVPFPWPRLTRLSALEDLVLAIPAAAIATNEKIGDVVHSDADAEIRLPASATDTLIHLRLKAGMSVWLSKSVQGVVVATDRRPRKIRVIPPTDGNPA